MLQKLLRGIVPALVLWIAAPAWAQDTATLSGTVTDATGAAVAGAKVTAIHAATTFESNTETNAEGLYRLSFLRPGDYKVIIVAPGFKRFLRDNVELRVGATLPINAALEVGAVADSVEVTAAASVAGDRDFHHRDDRRR